ncbi:MAG: ATP-binding protein [Rickettsiales bacterium]
MRRFSSAIKSALFGGSDDKREDSLGDVHDDNPAENTNRLKLENERLKMELKKISTLLNMSPYPIWQRNSDLDIEFYNLAYGEAVEDLLDDESIDTVPELDRHSKNLAQQANKQASEATERRHIIVGGERKLYGITEFPIPEEGITAGFAIDYSELDTLKEDVSRHILAQKNLMEISANAMAVYGADRRIKSFNNAFVALWKLDEMWLDSEPTYSEILETLYEKRRLPEQANFKMFKDQQIKLFTELLEPKEEFFYLPDGKALRVIAIPHALGGILFAYEDVTDRLALERSYNTLIAVQRETLDNLHEGLAVFGEDGRLKLSNPNYLAIWNLEQEFVDSEPHVSELLEKYRVFIDDEDIDNFRKQNIDELQIREFITSRIERSDGKVIDWRKVPLPDGATLITYLDATDSTLVERSLRERNEALQEADKLKTEFLANVSYELRSPLTSISGFSEMLKQEYFGTLSKKQREYVENIHNSSKHLMGLINDILDLAGIEAGYMRLDVSDFDISIMMKSVLTLITERSKEFSINIDFDCPADIGAMNGDETRIKQILFNLLSNALRYSKEGGSVGFGAREMGSGEIMLWVEDDGQGIPESEQEVVFSKFYKGRKKDADKKKSARSRDGSGTGLGLPIVKSFVELHGGRVILASEVGKGARFECYLPRNNPELKNVAKLKK